MLFFATRDVYGFGFPAADFLNYPAVSASLPAIWSAARTIVAFSPHETGRGTPAAFMFFD